MYVRIKNSMGKSPEMISIVCPCHNEQDVILLFLNRIVSVLNSIQAPYEILCINDGSTDATLVKLVDARNKYPQLRILNFSRNFGKEAALTAGLDHANGDVVIPIDADLQDPPELIPEMLKYWKMGYDVVHAKRANRSSDSFLKRITAKLFYKTHNKIAATSIPENVGDFRLISKKVVEAIKLLPENQRFMKGLFAWVGFKATAVEYDRTSRVAGKTKFSSWKLWNFALEGITSFSTIPLRIWLYLGLSISVLAMLYGVFIFFRTMILGIDVPGYASLITSVMFLGGMQLAGIGVIGEYIGRIYMESKSRPLYIIDNKFE